MLEVIGYILLTPLAIAVVGVAVGVAIGVAKGIYKAIKNFNN